MTAYNLYKCSKCHHEWQDTDERLCDWCGARAYVLQEMEAHGCKIAYWYMDCREYDMDDTRYMQACERGKLDV